MSWIASRGSSGRGVSGTAEVLHACLALATALWALHSLNALRDPLMGRPLWVGMVALSVGEAVHTIIVYRWIDEHTGPGWAAVLYHCTGLVASMAVIRLVHGLLDHSAYARRISLGIGAVAVAAAAVPLTLVPPARFPATLEQDPVMYDGTWRFAVHWAAFLSYLSYALVFASWTCAVRARQAGPGRLRISMALIGAGCAEGLLYVVGHSTIEVSTWLPGRSLTALDAPMDAVTLGTSIALIVCGASWDGLADFGTGLRVRADAWSMRRHILTIQPVWADLIDKVPEVSPFPDDIARAPVHAADLVWRSPRSMKPIHTDLSYQQARLVAEIYDAMWRLLPYVSAEQRDLVAKKVTDRGLRGLEAETATTSISLSLGIVAHAGHGVRPTREIRDPEVRGATPRDAAAEVARSIHRLNRPGVQRVIADILSEETS